jgi:hypothetical protein
MMEITNLRDKIVQGVDIQFTPFQWGLFDKGACLGLIVFV